MKTCVVLMGLVACHHSLQRQALENVPFSSCAVKEVVCIIDLIHFYDPESECGYEICVCKEAILTCGNVKYRPSINKKEVQCVGTIMGRSLKLFLPSVLNTQREELLFTVHESINIVNAEKEIVYRIRSGNYEMRREGDELCVVVELE